MTSISVRILYVYYHRAKRCLELLQQTSNYFYWLGQLTNKISWNKCHITKPALVGYKIAADLSD